MALSSYRDSTRDRANFEESLSRIETTLFKASISGCLWQVLFEAASKVDPLSGQAAAFVDAARRSAWTAALVHLSTLQDDRGKDTQSLSNLLNLGRKEGRFDSVTHGIIGEMLKEAETMSESIRLLRHNEYAHVSAILTPFDIDDIETDARETLENYLKTCVAIFNEIRRAAGLPAADFPDIKRRIAEDFDVFVANYSKPQG